MTYLKPSDEELAVQRSPIDCIFFESTEELYKFRIKIPETELYARGKTNERIGKDGSHSDKGTVWNFEKHNSRVESHCYFFR